MFNARQKHQRPAGGQQQIGNRNNRNNNTHSQQQHRRPQYPVGWATIEQINEQVKNNELLEGSNDLLAKMDTDAVRLRMDDIWREHAKQEVFLHLIVLTGRANQADIQFLTRIFLQHTFNSKLVDRLVKDHMTRPQHSAKILSSLAELLLIGWTRLPSLMAEKLAKNTEYIIMKVDKLRTAEFPSAELDELLKRVDVSMKDALERQNAAANTAAVERRGGGGDDDNRRRRVDWNESSGPPPEDFRTMDVHLTVEDIVTPNEAVYLRKAVVDGAYDDDEHYLDVQFRLLREDLCRPLRAGIKDFCAKQQQQNNGGGRSNNRNSLLVYRSVRFAGIELHTQDGKVLAYLRLSPNDQRRRMHRRFLFGSLICLSSDGFTDYFVFGTVVDRDGISGGGGGGRHHEKKRQNQNGRQFEIEKSGTIGVQLLLPDGAVATALREGIAYDLIESPAFYGSYSHVLRALQSIRFGQPIPFSNYLVRMHPQPALPRYQRNNHQNGAYLLNFGSLLVEPNAERRTRCSSRQLTQQFTADQFGMDQSQFEAFAYALSSELAVIQGPPGTGKTFLGLKVVEVLFENRHLWTTTPEDEEEDNLFDNHRFQRRVDLNYVRVDDGRRPMLIVCYTNHALDQFLEGIHTFIPDGIVRVGSQSKNEALEKFNLRRLQNDRSSYIPRDQRKRHWECREALKELGKRMEEMKKHLFGTRVNPGWIVPYAQLFQPAEDRVLQRQQQAFDTELKRRYCSFFGNHHNYTAWLTTAKPGGSAAERYDIYMTAFRLVHDCNVPEELANFAYLYCIKMDDWQMLDALSDLSIQRFWKQKFRRWLQKTGNEQECRSKISDWPTLAEVDSLQQSGLDTQVAVELLSSIKRDDGLFAENVRQIQQSLLTGGCQQQQNDVHPAPVPAAVVDFQAMGLHEDEEEDDYVDAENEARMFEEGDDDLLFDLSADNETAEAERTQHFEDSANLRNCLAKISTPMSDDECQQMVANNRQRQLDPWSLPLLTRWRLYKRWVQQWEPVGQQTHSQLIREYCAKREELDGLRAMADIEIMRHAKVIGMTTTRAAHLQSALRSVKPRIVVVEEAAEVFEQHIVTALNECCEHLILIGDHQQLRPSPEDYQLGKQYNLDISLFERLVKNGFEYRRLGVQHRMRPEISAAMMGHFYENLQDHSSVRDYPSVLGLRKNLYFVTHTEPETSGGKDDARSHANKFEAEFAVRLAQYLHKQGYDGSQITILCAYSDQFLDIRQRMGQYFGDNKSHGIRVENVDNYQGEESDIIILSLVRSRNPENRIGFLNTANRVCVAMSRAKQGLFIFGNMDFLAQNCNSNSPIASSSSAGGERSKNLWAAIRQSLVDADCIGPTLPIVCQVHGKAQEIARPDQFALLAPEGGCAQPCSVRMNCGHTCRKPCHAFDPGHELMKCMEKCGRKCRPEELHGCSKWCYQECDPCSEFVLKHLPCGHSRMAECHLKLEELGCTEPCPNLLLCGHPCANKCSQGCTEKCQVQVEKMLHCGHGMTLHCHEDPWRQQCQKVVQKRWPICGHVSPAKCHQDPALLQCPKPCRVPLADCEHPCTGTCGQCRQGRLHRDCAQDCKRILICGHECRAKCAKVCPPCPLDCETACSHNKCCMQGKKGKKLGRRCGERCAPCAEPCANRCAHQQCTKLCSEPCDIDPCVQPCSKLFPCLVSPEPEKGDSNNSFHPCIGVCGEKCLDICAKCKPEKFAEIKDIFFGTEDEEDARFVQLQDCGHILEATGLDKAIQVQLENRADGGDGAGDAAAIVVIKCPKCATPIRRSRRYIKLLNERAMQIEAVKKLLGDKTKEQLLAEWATLKVALTETAASFQGTILQLERQQQGIVAAFEKIHKAMQNVQHNEITGQWMVMAGNIHRLLLGFGKAAKRILDSGDLLQVKIGSSSAGMPSAAAGNFAVVPRESKLLPRLDNALRSTILRVQQQHLLGYLLNDLCELVENLAGRKVRCLADATLVQLSSELGRHDFLISIFTWAGKRHQQNGDIDAKAEQMLTDLLLNLQKSPQAFSEQKENLEKHFNDLVKHSGDVPPSKEEIVQIKRALGLHVTKWYQCSKGHIYGIGECGQATQQSQCMECKETVGGLNHQLVSTSREVSELNQEYNAQRAAANPFVARF